MILGTRSLESWLSFYRPPPPRHTHTHLTLTTLPPVLCFPVCMLTATHTLGPGTVASPRTIILIDNEVFGSEDELGELHNVSDMSSTTTGRDSTMEPPPTAAKQSVVAASQTVSPSPPAKGSLQRRPVVKKNRGRTPSDSGSPTSPLLASLPSSPATELETDAPLYRMSPVTVDPLDQSMLDAATKACLTLAVLIFDHSRALQRAILHTQSAYGNARRYTSPQASASFI